MQICEGNTEVYELGIKLHEPPYIIIARMQFYMRLSKYSFTQRRRGRRGCTIDSMQTTIHYRYYLTGYYLTLHLVMIAKNKYTSDMLNRCLPASRELLQLIKKLFTEI